MARYADARDGDGATQNDVNMPVGDSRADWSADIVQIDSHVSMSCLYEALLNVVFSALPIVVSMQSSYIDACDEADLTGP